jgi:hypothetical protein
MILTCEAAALLEVVALAVAVAAPTTASAAAAIRKRALGRPLI